MGNWVIQAIVRATLEWLLSLWVRMLEREKQIEQGREEVRKQVQEETNRIDDEFKKIDNSDISIDDALERLRLRSDRAYKVPGPTPTNPTSGGST